MPSSTALAQLAKLDTKLASVDDRGYRAQMLFDELAILAEIATGIEQRLKCLEAEIKATLSDAPRDIQQQAVGARG